MAVACASRFAVLKLEDDEILEKVPSLNAKSNQSPSTAKKNKSGPLKNGGGVSDSKSKPKKKKKANDNAELQNLAFGSGATKGKGKGGAHNSGPQRGSNTKQWEEWKKKDNEFVSEAYEQDLQQALLLSKIDYEEKKEVYDAHQKEVEHGKSNLQNQKKKKKNNKKEKGAMSLDEFQSLLPSQIESGDYSKAKLTLDNVGSPDREVLPDESDFFNKIEEDAEKIIVQEQRQEVYRNIDPAAVDARSLQLQDEIIKKDEQISSLTDERDKLKDELKNVKTRNKKLYQILATGEMREKAEILVQIEQLTSVKDELTDQMNEYHTALEQERSKVHSLQAELKKYQGNRKEHRDSK